MVKSSKKWIWAATCASALLFALPMPGQARVAMEYQQTEITVSGQVRSSQGEAIAGVTVRYGGAEASTDQNGRFSFQMATAGDVVFSAVGYAPHTERVTQDRSEEHTSELQSRENLVCRLLLEKKKQ